MLLKEVIKLDQLKLSNNQLKMLNVVETENASLKIHKIHLLVEEKQENVSVLLIGEENTVIHQMIKVQMLMLNNQSQFQL